MTKIPTTEGMTEIYIVLFVSLIFIVVMIFYYGKIRPLIKKRNHLKTKMEYSDDEEYLFWKNELKAFYTKYIPLLGKLIVKFMK